LYRQTIPIQTITGVHLQHRAEYTPSSNGRLPDITLVKKEYEMKSKKSLVLLAGLLLLSVLLAACGSSEESNFPSGKFIKAGTDYGLLFNTDGTFSVFNGSQTLVEGTYSVDGNVLTETSNNGGCETNVSFNYTFDGTNLTFNYVGNPDDDVACDGRHTDFNNVTYTLSE